MTNDIKEFELIQECEYECPKCFFSKILMKISDAPNPVCPVCYDKFVRQRVPVLEKKS